MTNKPPKVTQCHDPVGWIPKYRCKANDSM